MSAIVIPVAAVSAVVIPVAAVSAVVIPVAAYCPFHLGAESADIILSKNARISFQ